MSKSKDWTAFVGDTMVSSDLHLTVSGEINTGDVHQHQELRKKAPQGVVATQLILEVGPISNVIPEVFVHVSYKEKINGRHQYTSILILVSGTNEKLSEITEIEQHIS